jgi:hypothetical protein
MAVLVDESGPSCGPHRLIGRQLMTDS